MGQLLAEDLLLLCWDDGKGYPSFSCTGTLPVGVGGALILDLISTQAAIVSSNRIRPTNHFPDNKLLGDVLTELVVKRPPLTVHELVRILGTDSWFERVQTSLEDSAQLVAERSYLLGFYSIKRHKIVDVESAKTIRKAVIALLTGDRDRQDAQSREVRLAAIAGAIGALHVLVSLTERKKARERAAALADGQCVYRAVADVVMERVKALRLEAVAAGMGGAVLVVPSDSKGLTER